MTGPGVLFLMEARHSFTGWTISLLLHGLAAAGLVCVLPKLLQPEWRVISLAGGPDFMIVDGAAETAIPANAVAQPPVLPREAPSSPPVPSVQPPPDVKPLPEPVPEPIPAEVVKVLSPAPATPVSLTPDIPPVLTVTGATPGIGGTDAPPAVSAVAPGGGDDGILTASRLDEPPKVVRQVRPVYPSRARVKNQDGAVDVEFVVDATGAVDQVRVLDGPGSALFGDAATHAVKEWQFQPGRLHGRTVASRMTVRIRFRLE